VNGLLLVDKSVGSTSSDVVRAVRRAARQRKVGHAGTLDPLASGLLVVCLGEGTKLVPFLMEEPKGYRALVRLGAQTTTDDAEGEVVESAPVPRLDEENVAAALGRFVGKTEQVPPIYSALKVGGEPLYRKARRGDRVEPRPRTVEVYEIVPARLTPEEIEIDLLCAKGFYVRALARDLGRELGTRGHLAALRRTRCSGFAVEEAAPLGEIEILAKEGRLGERAVPLGEALAGMPAERLDAGDAARVRNGAPVPAGDGAAGVEDGGRVRLVDDRGGLVAVARRDGDLLRPARVFSERA